MQGKVIKLFITTDDLEKTRKSVQNITVDEEGIFDDKFYGKNSQRAILITSLDSYKMSSNNGIELKEGSLGENILVDINPYGLKSGDRFTICDIEFEITQNCTICKGLSSINSNLPELLKNDRGIFAKVISGTGKINIGDAVEILNH